MARRPSDRGAAAIETAFVLPILLFVLFAIMEIGGSLLSYSGTASAVRAAGRTASLAGSDPVADKLILNRVAQEIGAGGGAVELVVIWHAARAGDSVPPACVPATPFTRNVTSVGVSDGGTDAVGACNVYVLPAAAGGAFAMADGRAAQPADYYFGCQGLTDPAAATKMDCNWPGKNRRVLTSSRGAVTPHSSDFVGVYIRVSHSYYTTIFGSTLTITDQGISLIEPQGYEYP
jgi:hypothetical protein